MAKVGLLNIGTELLKGRTVNTNASWLGRRLFSIGLEVNEAMVIHDEGPAIEGALTQLVETNDIVIVTGGLGPTKDDITKVQMLKFFGGEMVMHAPTLKRLEEWSAQRNRAMNEPMRLQALVPSTCTVLTNRIGTAPGMAFRKGEKWIFSLPGIPSEMQMLMEEQVLPLISEYGTAWETAQVRLFGKPESEIAGEMETMESDFPKGLRISWLPTDGEVKIELSLPAQAGARQQLDALQARLAQHFAQWFVTSDDLSLAAVLGRELRSRGLSLACAESCTGGQIAAAVTAVSGSSNYFLGSLVTYAEDAKEKVLSIDPALIERHTVVSVEVAKAMALAVRAKLGADMAIATTGTAEVMPDHPVFSKPEIVIAVALGERVEARTIAVWQDRASNIRRAVNSALFLALKLLRNS